MMQPPEIPPMPQQPAPNYQYAPPPPPKQKFPVWAIVLIGCGGCGVLGIVVLAAVMFPVFAQAREAARTASCSSNLKMMSTGVMMYAMDYDEKYPPATIWMDTLPPYISSAGSQRPLEKILRCPSATAKSAEAYGYAYNSALSRLSMEKLTEPQSTPMIYDSHKTEKNATDKVQSAANPPRHTGRGHDDQYGKGNNFAYADGHVHLNKGTDALTGKAW